jgi:hypothetical protein
VPARTSPTKIAPVKFSDTLRNFTKSINDFIAVDNHRSEATPDFQIVGRSDRFGQPESCFGVLGGERRRALVAGKGVRGKGQQPLVRPLSGRHLCGF